MKNKQPLQHKSYVVFSFRSVGRMEVISDLLCLCFYLWQTMYIQFYFPYTVKEESWEEKCIPWSQLNASPMLKNIWKILSWSIACSLGCLIIELAKMLQLSICSEFPCVKVCMTPAYAIHVCSLLCWKKPSCIFKY